jgi:hypothetical protein
MTSKQPKLMQGWLVETCIELPKIEGTNDCDIDAAKYVQIEVATEKRAREIATQLLPKDCFGAVQIIPFKYRQIEPPLKIWGREYTGDAIEVSE